jgi:HK97 family phage major capsid protein
MQVNVPKIATGSQVAIQAAQGNTVIEQDLTDEYAVGNVVTLAGGQTASLQLIQQSPIAMDSVILSDLFAAHAQVSDYQTLYGTGDSGQLVGLANVVGNQTISFAGTSVQNIYDALAQATNMIWSTRYQAPDFLIINPIVWADWLSKLDNDDRPLFIPHAQGGAFNAAGIAANNDAQGEVGTLMGLRVLLDPNISTVGGDTTAFVIRSSDLRFYTSGPTARVFYETYAPTLQVYLQVFSFSTLISRFPQSIVQITDYSTAAVYGS